MHCLANIPRHSKIQPHSDYRLGWLKGSSKRDVGWFRRGLFIYVVGVDRETMCLNLSCPLRKFAFDI